MRDKLFQRISFKNFKKTYPGRKINKHINYRHNQYEEKLNIHLENRVFRE